MFTLWEQTSAKFLSKISHSTYISAFVSLQIYLHYSSIKYYFVYMNRLVANEYKLKLKNVLDFSFHHSAA
jgi:hypothetical protein